MGGWMGGWGPPPNRRPIGPEASGGLRPTSSSVVLLDERAGERRGRLDQGHTGLGSKHGTITSPSLLTLSYDCTEQYIALWSTD